jgi:hypothetical protein
MVGWDVIKRCVNSGITLLKALCPGADSKRLEVAKSAYRTNILDPCLCLGKPV